MPRILGNIDEVAIYPYALTPQQIQSHYFAKSVPPNSYASAIIATKPTNYWQLDEEGGLVANDIVGGKHGTISGGVTLGQSGIGKSMLFDGVMTSNTIGNITTPVILYLASYYHRSMGLYNFNITGENCHIGATISSMVSVFNQYFKCVKSIYGDDQF